MVRTFVDTNVLVYAYDADAGEKHSRARDLLVHLWEHRDGTLSTQVLQEFYVTVTRKLHSPLLPVEARRVISIYRAWPVHTISVPTVVGASEVAEANQISFWDALIIVAARDEGAERIVSEDLQPGRRIAGVTIENPFLS